MLRWLLVLTFFVLAAAGSAPALDLHFTTSNDLLAGDEDDLYTAELGADFVGERFSLSVGERLFTDRERGLRFDETHLAVAWPVEFGRAGSIGAWSGRARLEALRVGRGFAGESLQNAVHRLTGGEEVELEYIDGNRHFLGVGLDLARPLGTYASVDLWLRLEAKSTPGFLHRLEPSIGFRRAFSPWLAVGGQLGAQLNEAELGALEPRIVEFAEAWELTVDVQRVRLAWSYNSFGTGARHLSLSYRVGLAPARAPGRG